MTVDNGETITDADGPDAGFRTVVVFYMGLSATCLVAGVGLLVAPFLEVPGEVAIAIGPTVFTAVAVLAVLVGRPDDLPTRIGRNRRRQAIPFLPPLSLAVVLCSVTFTAPSLYPDLTSRTVVAVAVLATVALVPAIGVVTMARARYVTAQSGDEPATTCTWVELGWGTARRQLVLSSVLAMALFAPIVGWTSIAVGGSLLGLALAVLYLESTRGVFSETLGRPRSELRVHDAGVVVETSGTARFVPWESILDVRLTDDELRFERHLFDLRGDRSAIDDPDAVLEEIAQARGGSDDGK